MADPMPGSPQERGEPLALSINREGPAF